MEYFGCVSVKRTLYYMKPLVHISTKLKNWAQIVAYSDNFRQLLRILRFSIWNREMRNSWNGIVVNLVQIWVVKVSGALELSVWGQHASYFLRSRQTFINRVERHLINRHFDQDQISGRCFLRTKFVRKVTPLPLLSGGRHPKRRNEHLSLSLHQLLYKT